jgi:quinol monooxygenase YgiN
MTPAEAWHSNNAFEAHMMAAHTGEFRQKLPLSQGALYEERLYRALR